MAKIGLLYLNKGQWNGQQIVPPAWIAASSISYNHMDETKHGGYGYQWWVSKWNINNQVVESFQGSGNGGQYIFVVPALNAVVVFTGGNYSPLDQSLPYKLMQNVILKAML